MRRFTMRNHLTLPQGLQSGPGATNMRLEPGMVLELDEERARMFERFINGRVRAGDMEECEPEKPPAESGDAPIASRTRSRD